jgi:hypothetical protein
VSLGSLIDDYAEICNNQPEFRVDEGLPFPCSEVLAHIQAGFLGVFGNLMTCTVPHGLVARSLTTSDNSVCTAGDDGNLDSFVSHSHAVQVLQLLGDLAEEKCFDSRFPSVFLKLPFQTIAGLVVTATRLEFPNLNFVTAGNMDPRFDHLQDLSSGDKRALIYRQVVRFIRKLTSFPMEDWEYGIVASILNALIKRMKLRNDGRQDGMVTMPTRQGRLTVPAVPMFNWRDLSSAEFTRYFPHMNPNELFRVRRRGQGEYLSGDPLVMDDVLNVPGGRVWKLLEYSGYIESLPDTFDDDEESTHLFVRACDLKEYKEEGPELKRVRVLEDVPGYTMDMLFEKPEAAYLESVEVLQDITLVENRKRLKREFSNSRYYDLDAPLEYEVVLEYDDLPNMKPMDMSNYAPYESVLYL